MITPLHPSGHDAIELLINIENKQTHVNRREL